LCAKENQQPKTNSTLLANQAALETVRCEELQLEMKSTASTYKSRSSSSSATKPMNHSTATSSLLTSSNLGQSSKYTTASTGITSIMANNTSSVGHSLSKAETSTVTWAPTPDQKSSEIDRIMAKIEQARLSIANVCVLSENHMNIFSQKTILSFFLVDYIAKIHRQKQ
jgi:hypothetical protein